MDYKVKIYIDSGANIKFLKFYKDQIDFIEFQYDSMSNKRKCSREVDPSGIEWRDLADRTWEQANFTWAAGEKSEKFESIKAIVIQRKDFLHLDTAYKARADIFLTSDKSEIGKNKAKLESICGFKIFETKQEFEQAICSHIDHLLEVNTGLESTR